MPLAGGGFAVGFLSKRVYNIVAPSCPETTKKASGLIALYMIFRAGVAADKRA
jgi:hypothetical protein